MFDNRRFQPQLACKRYQRKRKILTLYSKDVKRLKLPKHSPSSLCSVQNERQFCGWRFQVSSNILPIWYGNFCTDDTVRNVDLRAHVFDEIALEGFDGITLEALWKRLDKCFGGCIPRRLWRIIWNLLAIYPCFTFYHLDCDRPLLPLECKTDIFFVNHENRNQTINTVCDLQNNVRGSSMYATNRTLLPKTITFESAMAMHQKFIIVADQKLRSSTIINPAWDPNSGLHDREYALLEIVGRSRTFGASGCYISALGFPGHLYHNLKTMASKNLITCHKRTTSNSGVDIYLKRFVAKNRSKVILALETLANYCRTHGYVTTSVMRRILGPAARSKQIYRTPVFTKFFRKSVVPYRTAYPNARKREWKMVSCNREKRVVIVKLVDPMMNISGYFENASLFKFKPIPKIVHGIRHFNCDVLRDIYLLIASHCPTYLSIRDIGRKSNYDPCLIKHAIQKLRTRKLVLVKRVSEGRQRLSRFGVSQCIPLFEIDPEFYKGPPQSNVNVILKAYQDDISTSGTFEDTSMDTDTDITEILGPIVYSYMRTSNTILNQPSNVLTFCNNDTTCMDISVLVIEKTSTNLFLSLPGTRLFSNPYAFRIPQRCKVHIYVAPMSSTIYTPIAVKNMISLFYLFARLFSRVYDFNGTQIRMCIEKLLPAFRFTKQTDSLRQDLDSDDLQISKKFTFDKYMGTAPQLIYAHKYGDNRVFVYESTQPSDVKAAGTAFVSKPGALAEKTYERYQNIVKMINENQVVEELLTLSKGIRTLEAMSGYSEVMCTKSLKTIVANLIEEGYIKAFVAVVVTKDSVERRAAMFCAMSIKGMKHPKIEDALNKLYVRVNSISCKNVKKTVAITSDRCQKYATVQSADIDKSLQEYNDFVEILRNFKPSERLRPMPSRNPYMLPKFARLRLLHEFLFYIVYQLDNEQKCVQPHAKLFSRFRLSQEKLKLLPPMYVSEVSWKMFVTPLPIHSPYPSGWFLYSDFLLRLPLSIFIKLVNIGHYVPHLDYYVKHPFKRHFLLKQLPINLRAYLMCHPILLESVQISMCRLSYIGVLQWGERLQRYREQVFLYLNRHASLLDTTTSDPGYSKVSNNDYNLKSFVFNTMNDVRNYWTTMQDICLHTPLGKRETMKGTSSTASDHDIKQKMQDALAAKTITEAPKCDIGILPGDHLGAAGLDSSLMSFWKKNWDSRGRTQFIIASRPKRPLLKATWDCQRATLLSNRERQAKNKYRKKLLPQRLGTKSNRRSIDNLRKRYKWTPAEDNCVSLLRCALKYMSLACDLRYDRLKFLTGEIFCDILHHIVPSSAEKNPAAVFRRWKRILSTNATICRMLENAPNLNKIAIIQRNFENLRLESQNQIRIAFLYLIAYIQRNMSVVKEMLNHGAGQFSGVDYFGSEHLDESEKILEKQRKQLQIRTRAEKLCNPDTTEEVLVNTIAKSLVACLGHEINPNLGRYWDALCEEWPLHLLQISVSKLLVNLRAITYVKSRFRFNGSSNVSVEGRELKLSESYKSVMINESVFRKKLFCEVINRVNQIATPQFKNSFETFTMAVLSMLHLSVLPQCTMPIRDVELNPNITDHSSVANLIATRFHHYLCTLGSRIAENEKACGTLETSSIDNEISEESSKDNSSQVSVSRDDATDDDDLKRNIIMKLIFRIPYLLEGDLEEYYKMCLTSSGSLIDHYLSLINSNLETFLNKNYAAYTNILAFLSRTIDIDDADETVERLMRLVFAIQYVMKEKSSQNLLTSQLPHYYTKWRSAVDFCEYLKNRRERNRDTTNACTSNTGLSIKPRRIRCSKDSTMAGCHKRACDGNIPSLEEIKIGMMDDQSTHIPHITDLTSFLDKCYALKDEQSYEIAFARRHHFITQYPTFEQATMYNFDEFVEKRKNISVTNEMVDRLIEKLERLANVEDATPISDLSLHSTQDLQYLQDVCNYIESGRHLGRSTQQLKTRFTNDKDLLKCLASLSNSYNVLRTGIESIIFVHWQYCSKWTIEKFVENEPKDSACEMEADQSHLVVPAPWMRFDGTVDRNIFVQRLTPIMSYCLECPNLSFTKLCKQFYFSNPVDLFTLVEMLEDLGCLQILMHTNTEYGLTVERDISISRKATILDSFDCMYMKLKPSAFLVYGAFVKILLE